jgi:hypothetical protein
VQCNKPCNRAELEFVGPRVHSLSKCSRQITWQKLITICATSRQARENVFAVSLAVVEGHTELYRVVKIPSDRSPICPRYPAAWLSLCTT